MINKTNHPVIFSIPTNEDRVILPCSSRIVKISRINKEIRALISLINTLKDNGVSSGKIEKEVTKAQVMINTRKIQQELVNKWNLREDSLNNKKYALDRMMEPIFCELSDSATKWARTPRLSANVLAKRRILNTRDLKCLESVLTAVSNKDLFGRFAQVFAMPGLYVYLCLTVNNHPFRLVGNKPLDTLNVSKNGDQSVHISPGQKIGDWFSVEEGVVQASPYQWIGEPRFIKQESIAASSQ